MKVPGQGSIYLILVCNIFLHAKLRVHKTITVDANLHRLIYNVLCVRVCVCILSPWRLLPTVRCPRHTGEIQINDRVLWIFIWLLLACFFISVSENVKFHLQRRKLQPPQTGEKTIWYIDGQRKDDKYWYRI